MLKRGRPPRTLQRVAVKIQLDLDLAAELDMLCFDPLRGKPSYGDRSDIINKLLRAYLKEQRIADPV